MTTMVVVMSKYQTALARGNARLELLEAAKTREAEHLRSKVRKEVNTATEIIIQASTHTARIKDLKTTLNVRTKNLKSALSGTWAVILATDPELADKLPSVETWLDKAPQEQAEHMIQALIEVGTETAKVFAQQLQAVANQRMETLEQIIALESMPEMTTKADNAVAKLNLVVSEADVYLRGIAKPGTELAALLEAANTRGKGKSKSSKKASAASTSTDSTAANPPSPQPPPARVGGVATPQPPVPSPAPVPAPTLPQPPAAVAPVSPQAGAVPMVNGVAGSPQRNGVVRP